MKTRLLVFVAAVAAILLSGCSSMFSGNGDDPSAQARAKQRELNSMARSTGYMPPDSSSYPGGTTAAEWKSLTSEKPR